MCENLLNSTGVKVLYLSYENLYIAFAKKIIVFMSDDNKGALATNV